MRRALRQLVRQHEGREFGIRIVELIVAVRDEALPGAGAGIRDARRPARFDRIGFVERQQQLRRARRLRIVEQVERKAAEIDARMAAEAAE